ncbi:MAG: hypothetical protein P8L42_03240, partial [Flavicella sp.]|nr:hypothetical protein [Flavicella sp.]
MKPIRVLTAFFAIACISLSHGQEKKTDSITVVQDSIKVEVSVVKDTIINEVAVNHPVVIDSLWLETMYSSPLYDALPVAFDGDMKKVSINDVELTTELLRERLERLNEQTPFNLEYNPELERLIKYYLKT